jgi:hypothetical protein
MNGLLDEQALVGGFAIAGLARPHFDASLGGKRERVRTLEAAPR